MPHKLDFMRGHNTLEELLPGWWVCVCMCGRENILRIRDLDGVCPGSVCADGQLLLADICISRGRPRVCVWMIVDGHI